MPSASWPSDSLPRIVITLCKSASKCPLLKRCGGTLEGEDSEEHLGWDGSRPLSRRHALKAAPWKRRALFLSEKINEGLRRISAQPFTFYWWNPIYYHGRITLLESVLISSLAAYLALNFFPIWNLDFPGCGASNLPSFSLQPCFQP